MTVASTVGVGAKASSATRWTQLVSVIICMVMIANLQYGWTLFVNPMRAAHPSWSLDFLWWHWDTLTGITFAFTVFIALETWLTPIQGWIVDNLGAQRGPKLMVAFGGVMVAAGWVINSMAESLPMLYLGAVVGGIG